MQLVRGALTINGVEYQAIDDIGIQQNDSLGNELPIHPGDINLKVAGKGIVHSERERPELQVRPHSIHGFQLWLALPVEDE